MAMAHIGRRVGRNEDDALVRGQAKFTDDLKIAGALEAAGPADLRRRLRDWLGLSAFAQVKGMRAAPAAV